MTPSADLIADIMKAAAARQPMEMCGVVVEPERFIEIPNRATAWDAFVMDPVAYAEVSRAETVVAIVHSHVYTSADPSDGDRAMCEKTGLPWLIVSWPTGAHVTIVPTGYVAPLVGRPWAWGTLDCYGLIRDALRLEAGVDIPDYPRAWLWWEQGGDILVENFADAGFVEVEGEPRHLDVMLMAMKSPVPNHCGIILDGPTGPVLLHQLMGRLSVREVWGGIYRRTMTHHLRHRSLAA